MKRILLSLAILLVLYSAPSHAQEIVIQQANTSQWPEVSISAIIPHEDAQTASYALVFEDDEQSVAATDIQKIEAAQQNRYIVIAIDTSKTLTMQNLQAIKDAVSRYIEGLHTGEFVTLLAFNDHVQIASGFTNDKEQLTTNVNALKLAGSSTELYKAALYGLDLLNSVTGTRTLFIISDGKDEGTEVAYEHVVQAAKDHNIQISSVGVLGKIERAQEYLDILQGLTQESGGEYHTAQKPEGLTEASYNMLVLQSKTFVDTRDHSYAINFTMPQAQLDTDKAASLTCAVGENVYTAAVVLPAVEQVQASDGTEARPDTPSDEANGTDVPAASKPSENPAETSAIKVIQEHLTKVMDDSFLILCGLGLLAVIIFSMIIRQRKKNTAGDEAQDRKKQPSTYVPRTPMPTQAPKAQPTSYVLDFQELGLSFPLATGSWHIGARRENDIVIDEATVSGRHAVVHVSHDACRIQDMQSTNGIIVNGVLAKGPVPLKAGDQLLFGKAKAVLRVVHYAKKG